MLTKVKQLMPLAIGLLPVMALAQNANVRDIQGLLGFFIGILNDYIVPLIVAIAVVVFMWGLIQFVTAGDDETGRTNGRNRMIYGIIVLFVILSVWGLVNILQGTFGTAGEQLPGGQLPNLPGPRS